MCSCRPSAKHKSKSCFSSAGAEAGAENASALVPQFQHDQRWSYRLQVEWVGKKKGGRKARDGGRVQVKSDRTSERATRRVFIITSPWSHALAFCVRTAERGEVRN